MQYFVYILFSVSLNKYYIGSTTNISERVRKHNTNHKGFTGKVSDWTMMWSEQHLSGESALKREKQIKAWKSRTMIEKLITAG